MRDDLPVGKCRIRGTVHGGKIVLSLGRSKWCASQLLILYGDAIAAHGFLEQAEIVAGHLMAETARTTMYHHSDLFVAHDAQGSSGDWIKYPLVRNHLNFEVVIA